MIWIDFGWWFLAQGRWFTRRRIYLRWSWIPFERGHPSVRGRWTPFVLVTWPGLRDRYFTYRRRDA